MQKLLVTQCERQEREMQMRDDLGITTKLENGKAYLEFALPEKIGRLLSALQIEIWEGAEGERLVFHGEYSSEEADSMTALLLRPHLWDGMRDPYVYLVKAQGRFRSVEYGEKMGGMEKEEKLDSAEDITGEVEMYWRQELTIYDVRVVEKKGILLNEKEFLPHEVVYRLPPQISDAGTRVEQVRRDLERLVQMGVNVIRLEGTGTGAEGVNCSEVRTFYSLCRKRGFLTGDLWIRPENLPVYRGLPGETTCRSTPGGGRQDTDGAILLLSGKMEQRTGALSGTFHPASSGERIAFPDNLQQSEKSGALCGRSTFFIPVGRIR